MFPFHHLVHHASDIAVFIGNPGPENLEPAQSAANNKNQKKKATPTIYYAS